MAKSKRSMMLGGGLEVAAADAVYTPAGPSLDSQENIPKLILGDYLSVNWGFYLFEQDDDSSCLVER